MSAARSQTIPGAAEMTVSTSILIPVTSITRTSIPPGVR
jgi:hypothetical protein